MTPLRIAFLLVFVAATAAFFIARSAVASFSLGPQMADVPIPTPKRTPTSKPTARPSPRPTRAVPTATTPPRPTATPRPAPTVQVRPSSTPAPTATRPPRPSPTAVTVATATAVPKRSATPAPRRPKRQLAARHRPRHRVVRPTPVPTPSPIPTTGITTITNYWISETAARRGTTIAVGYTIDNGTGATERVLLGASIKPSSVATWGRSVSDPYHDVVAIVPPGITTHVRYFTLARGLRPGAYDVAWGLRGADTGTPVALVTARDSLRITR